MSDAWEKSARNSGDHAVAVEIVFALLYFFLIEKAHSTPLTVGKAVDNWAAEIVAGKIVDGSSAIGSESSEDDYEPNVEITCSSMIGGGSDNEFGRHGNDGALQEHEEEDGTVVEL